MSLTVTQSIGSDKWRGQFREMDSVLNFYDPQILDASETSFSFQHDLKIWTITGTDFAFTDAILAQEIRNSDAIFTSGIITEITISQLLKGEPDQTFSAQTLSGISVDAATFRQSLDWRQDPLTFHVLHYSSETTFIVEGEGLRTGYSAIPNFADFFAPDMLFQIRTGKVALDGGAGNDTFIADTYQVFSATGGRGDDTILIPDLDAISRAYYKDIFEEYTLTELPDGTLQVHSDIAIDYGTDTLSGIDYLHFVNGRYHVESGVFSQNYYGRKAEAELSIDADDEKPWAISRKYYKSDGISDSFRRITENDDGVRITHFFLVEGFREVFRQDLNDAHSWAQSQTRLFGVGEGTFSRKLTEYDDGRARYETFLNGQKEKDSRHDLGDAHGWARKFTAYTADGTLSSHIAVLDNGLEKRFTYSETGQLDQLHRLDTSDQFKWAAETIQFDPETGDATSRTRSLDNGNTFEITYENGQRSQTVLTDAADLGRWTTITQTYDARGDLEDKLTVYDDGSVVTEIA